MGEERLHLWNERGELRRLREHRHVQVDDLEAPTRRDAARRLQEDLAGGALPFRAVGKVTTDVPFAERAGRLRVEHKQASLEELGQIADPPLTKDAIAGRIRRLLAMADKRAADLGIASTEASLTADMLAQ